MTMLHGRVKGGHIVVDEPTDLPEGTEVTVSVLDADDLMSVEERAQLDETIEQARIDIAAGRGMTAEELLARVRAS